MTSRKSYCSSVFVVLLLPAWVAVLSIPGQLSEYMWNKIETERTRTLNSTFIKNVQDGTLDPTAFGVFNLQDTVYTKGSAESWKTAASKESSPDIRKFMDQQHVKNMQYANDMLSEWHSLNASAIRLGNAMAGYVAFERHVAETMDPIYFIAANIPCYKLWPWIGSQIDFANSGVYKLWAQTSFNATSHSYKALESYIDEAFAKGQLDLAKTLEVYKTCMNFEMKVFETAAILNDCGIEFKMKHNTESY